MKKFIVGVAAAALFVGCGGVKNDGNAVAESVVKEAGGQIAYVQLDSLMTRYDMYTELSAAFEAKAKQAEADLSSRGRSLERKYTDFQNKVEKGLVTRAEAAQLQENLQRESQNFSNVQSQKEQELAEENQVMMNKILNEIQEFIAEYNKDYRYGMIVTTTGSTPVLHADPQLDITADVIAGLNARYKTAKAAQ